MFKNLFYSCVAVLTAATAQAATISVVGADLGNSGTTADVDGNAASITAAITGGATNTPSAEVTYTISGGGLAAPVVVVVDTERTDGANLGNNSNGRFNTPLDAAGDELSVVLQSISGATLGPNGFDFTSIDVASLDTGDTYSLTDSSGTTAGLTASPAVPAADTTAFSITLDADSVGNGFRIANYNFTIDVVTTQIPEPTSVALICLGVAGVLVRRNRG